MVLDKERMQYGYLPVWFRSLFIKGWFPPFPPFPFYAFCTGRQLTVLAFYIIRDNCSMLLQLGLWINTDWLNSGSVLHSKSFWRVFIKKKKLCLTAQCSHYFLNKINSSSLLATPCLCADIPNGRGWWGFRQQWGHGAGHLTRLPSGRIRTAHLTPWRDSLARMNLDLDKKYS